MKKQRMLALLLALLCLTAALPALADERTADSWYFGGTGQDTIYVATPLPTGNLLLTGYTQLGRNGREMVTGAPRQTRAWLLCLKPDGSILWEAVDETKGTTRYVSPLITSGGDIAVLFYNAPSQVTTEVAIHIYSMDGQLKEKVPLPLEVGLVEGVMTDGFVFYDWEKGYTAASLDGTLRTLDLTKEEGILTGAVEGMIPWGEGWVAAGRTRDENAFVAVAAFDGNGKRLWRYAPQELADGIFSDPCFQQDGTMLVNWYKPDLESDTVLESRMICLDTEGKELWQVVLPKDVCGNFTITDAGWMFKKTWMEKTYTHFLFTLVGKDGAIIEQRMAEKRQDMLFGAELFTLNGEAWFHADAERQANRINDRQTDLELQDALIIRISDCAPVTNAQ